MPPTEILLGGVIVIGLVLYLLLAGADFGGGIWDLLASGPRREAQRRAIEHAIGPIWEANHVWLILVVVILFSAFPPAFAAISTALHVPLTLFLLGVVLRGSAFTFRSFHAAARPRADRQAHWGLVFSSASVLSPLLLGMTVGAIASGGIRVSLGPDGARTMSGFFAPWLAPFPLAVGLFAFALCAFLAATYLAAEVTDPGLQWDFQIRALTAGVVVGLSAALAFLLSGTGAPRIHAGLTTRPWAWPLHIATALCAIGAFAALWKERFAWARVLVAGQTTFILLGWAAAQYPYLVVPDVTLWNAASPSETRSTLLFFLAAGLPILVPSLLLLYRVFKVEGEASR
jgi:cytochrome d ubiquinol oxidase subunit II